MPTIARFYGIMILMHQKDKEHNPPHIHAIYGDYQATFLISDGEMHVGEMPTKAKQLIKEFINLHRDELLTMWETQNIRKLPPLE